VIFSRTLSNSSKCLSKEGFNSNMISLAGFENTIEGGKGGNLSKLLI
jgi:hypothetical protein